MLSALVSAVWDEPHDINYRTGRADRRGNSNSRACPSNTYLTADDKWVSIAAFSLPEWKRLLEATGLTELARPELDEQAERLRHRELIDRRISRWVRAHTQAEVIACLSRTAATCAPVMTIADILADLRYQKSLLCEVRHPVYGSTGALGAAFPIIVDGQQIHSEPAPALGQHTDLVLRDIADMTEAEITVLKASGAGR